MTKLIPRLFFAQLAFMTMLCLAQNPCAAASHDGKVEWDGLFHDQGELFDNNPEPKAGSKVQLKIRALKDDITGATIKYWQAQSQTWKLIPMTREEQNASRRYEYWMGSVPVGKGKSSYRFCLKDGDSVIWYNALGPAKAESDTNDFKLIPDFKTPDWLKKAVIYQIFVDRFCNGNSNNDVKGGEYSYQGKPTVQRHWGDSPLPNAAESTSMIFYGGDLEGVSSKLAYITDTVGANVIYLNPIFTAPSNHKYDTADYDTVDVHFGSAKDLENLSAQLHSRAGGGGKLILDGVFNHTGDSHFWFNKYNREQPSPGAYQSLSSPYKNFYTFSNWPKEYATFLDVKDLPKLNFNSSAVRAAIYSTPDSVAQKYLRAPFNIDGWRLDAPQYADGALYQGSDNENHIIWEEFRQSIKTRTPDAAILGEFWGDAGAWTNGGEWDSVTNFDGFTKPVSEWITGKDFGGEPGSMSVSDFDSWLRRTRAHYPSNVQQCLSNHLSNHDIPRFAERAGHDQSKVTLALYFQMTYSGAPTIYYGDEYGMPGGADPDDRRCFDWSKGTGDNDLVALTHKLIAVRKKYSALRSGSFMTLKCADDEKVYCFGRCDKESRIAIVLNNDSVPHDVLVPIYQLDPPNGTFRDAISGAAYESHDGVVSIKTQPHQGIILVNTEDKLSNSPHE